MDTLLDANAVLRYLLEDNDDQAERVEEVIAKGAEVTVEVLAECVYVLADVYEVPRSGIAESLGILLDEVHCDRFEVAATALGLFSGSKLDFVDSVLAAEYLQRGRDVLSFDKKLNGLLTSV